ncbi:MAG: single-stranded DNA-binding protein [Firmicutes bacterium]|nr:single-stranded DNA-binding protein [Bacillota bacterium]
MDKVEVNYLENNKVTLIGKVASTPVFSHELFDEKFYEFMLEVPRLSEYSDQIPVTVSDRLLKIGHLEIGQTICVSGQFRSYNKLMEGRSRLMLTVFVRDLPEIAVTNPNTIALKGYICKPPIYRTTPFDREICDMLIAVNRAYNKSDYIPCIAWGRNARFIKDSAVGQKLVVSGRIQSRSYVKKISETESVSKVAYEVSIGKIIMNDEPAVVLRESRSTAESIKEGIYDAKTDTALA